ncbi:MAG: hypothetical protein ACKOTB_17900, partial [Planctomycetia bacterium]
MHVSHRLRLPLPSSTRWSVPLAAVVAVGMVSIAGTVSAQDDARFPNFTKVESAPETRTFKDALKAGTFDAASREYLETVALPQFEAPGNRLTIERMRKRFREYLLADAGSEKAANDANGATMEFVEALASKDDADPVVRVNAMLLIGELQGIDRKPWPPAVAPLTKVLADDAASPALRIAALIGLVRHVDAAKASPPDQQRLATAIGPAVVSILKAPARATPENDWIVAKCLGMLPLLGPASPETVGLVLKVVEDANRSINTRVRASKALADVATPAAKIDGPAVVGLVEKIAVESLERDVVTGDQRRLERQFGVAAGPLAGPPGMSPAGYGPPAGMVPGMIPGMAPGSMPPGYGSSDMSDPAVLAALEQTIPREVCRRAAWRLATLADAVLSDDAKRGLATVGGEVPPPARELAQKLRRAAMDLDATPDDPTLRQALAEFKPQAPAVTEEVDDEAPAKKPAAKPGPKAGPKPAPAPKPAAEPAADADP